MTKSIKLGPIPDYVFADCFHDISVQLKDDSAGTINESIEVEATCLYENTNVVPIKFCTIEQPRLFLDKNTGGNIRVFFNDVSASNTHENRKIVIVVKTVNNDLNISAAISAPIYVIRYKLIIEEENQQQYVWYKDEGGKDKCIELHVKLVDKDNKEIRNRNVPLKASLIYDNGQLVENQGILTLNEQTRPFIDDHHAIFKMRVNEVSSSHQRHCFQVIIAPDTHHSSNLRDIASVKCTPIDVKSKRNSHHKDKERAAERAAQMHPGAPVLDATNKRARHADIKGSTTYTPSSQNVHVFAPLVSQVPVNTRPIVRPLSLPPADSGGLGLLIESTRGDPDSESTDSDSDPYHPATGNGQRVGCEVDLQASHAALQTVQKWLKTAMDGIDALQWKPLGFYQREDGSEDFHHPLYSMPNPNATIEVMKKTYAELVETNLAFLGTQLSLPVPEGSPRTSRKQSCKSLPRDGRRHSPTASAGHSSKQVYVSGSSECCSDILSCIGNGDVFHSLQSLSALQPSSRSLHALSSTDNNATSNSCGNENPNQNLNIQWHTSAPSPASREYGFRYDMQLQSQNMGQSILSIARQPSTDEFKKDILSLYDADLNRLGRQHTFTFSPSVGLNRDDSLSLGLAGAPSLPRDDSMGFLDCSPSGLQQPILLRSLSEAAEMTVKVYFIHARSFITDDGRKIGLPSFDYSKSLIGFYHECEDFDRTTYSSFLSLNDIFPPLAQNTLTNLKREFDTGLNNCDASVFSMRSGKHKCLSDMADDALIYDLTKDLEDF